MNLSEMREFLKDPCEYNGLTVQVCLELIDTIEKVIQILDEDYGDVWKYRRS